MAFAIIQVFIISFAFHTICSARNSVTLPSSENDAISIGNHAPPTANSGRKLGHSSSVYLRNDVSFEEYRLTRPNPKRKPHPPPVDTEDYGPTGPNPKHKPHPPPVDTEDYGPTGPNPKHKPHPPINKY